MPRFESTAGDMQELREAHAQLRFRMSEMEAVTSNLAADRLEYTSVRYRLSKSSRARRTCFNAICAKLSIDATPEELAMINRLASSDRELMSKSAAHVRAWTAEMIDKDWHGYCLASRGIRQHMEEEIQAEEKLLFAILERRRFDAPLVKRGHAG